MDFRKIKAVKDRLVIERQDLDALSKKESLIITPDAYMRPKEKPQLATVLSVGPEVTIVVPGERIIVGKYAGTDLMDPDASNDSPPRIGIIRETEILGVVIDD